MKANKISKKLPYKDQISGGRADKRRPEEFDAEQIKLGTAHEREHTSNAHLAREIAMDHLAEDPKYYTHLKRVEKAVKKKEKPDEAKKTPTRGNAKQKAGKGGQVKYTYPQDRVKDANEARGGEPNREPDASTPAPRVPEPLPIDLRKFSAQMGVSTGLVGKIATRFKKNPKLKGRAGFSSFMSSRLKEACAKHGLDQDYMGRLYDAAVEAAVEDAS